MSLQPDNFYARRRVLSSPAAVFHEHGTPSDRPTERIVQSIWQHQRLRRDQLQTATGRPIRVLHPGFVSVEGGPDFRSAVLQIGDDPPCSGDVEVDLRPGGWRGHGHDRNPAFQNVILQVLWDESPPAAGTPPGLVLKNYLDTPLEELALSLENQPLSTLPAEWRGRCCAPLHALNEEKLAGLLRDAAHVRLETKAAQLRARARQAGWEQSLWEGLFRALGYKHNVWPMQSLAETRSRWQPGADTVLTLQTRLLGVGGLLPDELTRAQKSSDTWLRRAWDGWWRERDAFLDCLLPHSIWKFHGLRPANHPQRRLVLAMAGQGRPAGPVGKLVHVRRVRPATARVLASAADGRAGRFLVLALDAAFTPIKHSQNSAGRKPVDGSRGERHPALVVGARGGRQKRTPARHH